MVKFFAINGVDGYTIDIETKLMSGQPLISIIGLGDLAVKEAAERIQSAIDESGYVFPKKRVIISLAPSDKKKSGSHFDLAMAIGVLQQNNDITAENFKSIGFIGELSLDGRLRACRGILPMVMAAKKAVLKRLLSPVKI
jgi:magnesium chelatase family protein